MYGFRDAESNPTFPAKLEAAHFDGISNIRFVIQSCWIFTCRVLTNIG